MNSGRTSSLDLRRKLTKPPSFIELFEELKNTEEPLENVDWSGIHHRNLVSSLLVLVNNQHNALKRISLRGCLLRDSGTLELAKGLKESDNGCIITHLDLSGNGISNSGLAGLAQIFLNSKRQLRLQELLLAWNSFSDEGTCTLARVMKQNIGLLPLQKLDLSGVASGGGGGVSMYNSITTTFTPENIGDAGMKDLAQTVGHCGGSLTSLSLNRQKITSIGIQYLCQSRSLNFLVNLELTRLPIDDHGAFAISKALVSSPSLVTLDLSINRISNDGAKALADGLLQNKSLNTLLITQNAIGLVGLMALENAISLCVGLKKFDACGHEAGKPGIKVGRRIQSWLRLNRRMDDFMKQDSRISNGALPLLIVKGAKLPDKTRLFSLLKALPWLFRSNNTTR